MIVGWRELRETTGISIPVLHTLVRVRDFPKPVVRTKGYRAFLWSPDEVNAWLARNPKPKHTSTSLYRRYK